MKSIKCLILLIFSILFVRDSSAQQTIAPTNTQTVNTQTAKNVKNPELREELLKRLSAARAMREDLKKYNGKIPAAEFQTIKKNDAENTAWIKSLMEKNGWLGISLVGEDGEDAAFRFVRNSSQDPDFQKKSLELLRKAIKEGEAPVEQAEPLATSIQQSSAIISNNPNSQTSAQPPARSIQTKDNTTADANQPIKYPQLRDEILQRIASDQAGRMEILKNHPQGQKLPDEVFERFKKIDQVNTEWMKEIIKKYGYPGFSLVGKEATQAAFVLIQHADQDLEFQKQCLELLRQAVAQKEALPSSLAYLTDRVLVAEGKSQIYGTQIELINGKVMVKPIEDEANVDKRRAEVGLPPLADYLKMIQQRNIK